MKYARSALFEGFSETEYQSLIEKLGARDVKYKKGEIVYTFGSGNDLIGFMLEGGANIVRTSANGDSAVLEKLRRSDIFGDMLAYGRNGEYIFVKAETNCTVLYLPFSEVMATCSGGECYRHKFLINLTSILCKKTMEVSDRLAVISNHTIREKLLTYFSICSEKQQSEVIRLEMSLCALADYICVDRSAMMREIKKLKEEGVIDMKDKKVTLYNT